MDQVIAGLATAGGLLQPGPTAAEVPQPINPAIAIANFPRPEPRELADAASDAHDNAVQCLDHDRSQWHHLFIHAVDVDMRDVHADMPWPAGIAVLGAHTSWFKCCFQLSLDF